MTWAKPAIPWVHMMISIIIQAALFFSGQATATGGALAAGCTFLMWEFAQAQYRWMSMLGDNTRASLPWWAAADPRIWTTKSLLDFLVPLGLCLALARFLYPRFHPLL